MSKKIYTKEIDGVMVPEPFQGRFYDKRKHRGRIKLCSCNNKFYDETPRVTANTCLNCRIAVINSTNDVDPNKAIDNPRRHKRCHLCGNEFLDTSLACSRKYCITCSASHSYDMLEKFVRERGRHPLATSYEYSSEALETVKNHYDGVKSDVEIANETGMLEEQVRYLRRVKAGLSTVSYDSKRIRSGKPSIASLDAQEVKQAITKRTTYKELASKYGVKPCTIKKVFKKTGFDRSALSYLPIELSDRVRDIIIGHVLGDGCIIPISKGKAAYFKVGHKIADKEFTDWSADELICLKPIMRKQSKFMDGRSFEFISFNSLKTSTLVELYKKFYDPTLRKKYGTHGCKNPSLEIFEQLSDLSLAIWYMDDGSYNDGYPEIAMNCPALDYDLMCDVLSKRFGIKFYVIRRKQVTMLRVRGKFNRGKFFDIIRPHIHPRMARKLPIFERTVAVYSEDPLSTKFPTSVYRELDFDSKGKFIDKFIEFILEIPPPINKLEQTINEYLGDLQERLNKCLPENATLPFLLNGLTYLDTICPHRFTSNHNGLLSYIDSWKSEKILRKCANSIFESNQVVTLKNFSRRIMEMITAPGHFRPSGSSALINLYKPSSVLDPFAGWCGRALSCALNQHVKYYVGIDLQEQTVHSIRKILEDTQPFGVGQMKAVYGDALEYMKDTDAIFDMVLAGPPYYKVENYNGITQSGTFSEWLKEFVEPFCALVPKVLTKKGILALHIFDTHQYSFIEPFMFALKQNGLKHEAQFQFGKLKNTNRYQYIHIFTK
jgi:tRNA1(Val) A37 N6-methylase TrmN6